MISILMGLIIAMSIAGIGAAFLYLGFLMLQKKSLVIPSNFMNILVGASFLMIATGMLSKFIFSDTKNWAALIFLAIYAGIFFAVKKLFGRLMVFNIEENVLYHSIFEVLQTRKIKYEKRNNKIIIPSFDAHMVINSHKFIQTTTIHVVPSTDEDFFENLTPIFKKKISGKPFNRFSWVGLVYVIIGLCVIILSISFVLAAFSRLSNT